MNNPKVEFNIGEPVELKLLTDNVITGVSQYGHWNMFPVLNDNEIPPKESLLEKFLCTAGCCRFHSEEPIREKIKKTINYSPNKASIFFTNSDVL